jgi:hypothetical protein
MKSKISFVGLNEQHLPSDAIGYNIGEYLYHITTKRNVNTIKKNGFIPSKGRKSTKTYKLFEDVGIEFRESVN